MRNLISCLAILYSLFLLSDHAAHAHGAEIGSIKIHHPWTRATPKGANVAGGFMAITNSGQTDDRLVAIRIEGVERVEIHDMTMENGMMKMRPLANGLALPAGQTIILKPGSFHVMMMGLSAPLTEGDFLKAQLTFDKAGTLDVEFVVEAQGANLKQQEMKHTH